MQAVMVRWLSQWPGSSDFRSFTRYSSRFLHQSTPTLCFGSHLVLHRLLSLLADTEGWLIRSQPLSPVLGASNWHNSYALVLAGRKRFRVGRSSVLKPDLRRLRWACTVGAPIAFHMYGVPRLLSPLVAFVL
ncbi:hypothetical protein YC2023_033677 [Brassica napus]